MWHYYIVHKQNHGEWYAAQCMVEKKPHKKETVPLASMITSMDK